MMNLVLLALTCLLSTPPEGHAQEPAAPAGPRTHLLDRLLPVPSRPVRLEAEREGRLPLATLLDRYAEASGARFMRSRETATLLQQQTIEVTHLPSLEAREFPLLLENLMRSEDFIFVAPRSTLPMYVEVISLRTNLGRSHRERAVWVEPGELDLMARHPAWVFTTVLDLPGIDVRQLSNSTRSLLTDPNLMQVVPAGDTDSMILQALGDQMVTLITAFRSIGEWSHRANAQEDHGLTVHALEHAAPDEAQALLTAMMAPAPAAPSRNGSHPQQAQAWTARPLQWHVDRRTRLVFAHGPEDSLHLFHELLERLDVPAPEQGGER